MSIADLQEGEKAIIENIDHAEIPLKLIELGCLPGNEVELIQRAPFQDPICIKLNGSNLAIREELAKRVQITKVEYGR